MSSNHPDGPSGPMRTASIHRKTNETEISLNLNLDGQGLSNCKTGVGFFDHMLDQLARHALIDLEIHATGDLHIDDHHTVEDTGIVLGQALRQAMGDKRGIQRYGSFLLAMDEALSQVALDLSNRPYLAWNFPIEVQKIGTFDTELVREFFQAVSHNAGITLHVDLIRGFNAHHMVESLFKAFARALRMALEIDPRKSDALPTTKGAL